MQGSYPFIDIATLDGIRDGFVRGDAQIVLSPDLSVVLWINSIGAKFFGFETIDEVLGESLEFPSATVRQIEAFGKFEASAPKQISIRLAKGLKSELKELTVAKVLLPDGQPSLLLSSDAAGSPSEIIADLADDVTHVALLDEEGLTITASPQFGDLMLADATLDDLIIEANDAPTRVVRRNVRVGEHAFPGAIARLQDTPSLYLLCLVTEKEADSLSDDDTPPVDSNAPESRFVFKPDGPIGRFIWYIDEHDVFQEISPALAESVGSHASDVIGRNFRDVANVFGFDTDGEIAKLLQSKDSWAEKQIFWPIEGTTLRVPIELSALPIFEKDRSFKGFRGFGVVNPKLAEPDPDKIGLALAGTISSDNIAQNSPVTEDDFEDDDDVPLAWSEAIANDDRETDHLSRLLAHTKPAVNKRPPAQIIKLHEDVSEPSTPESEIVSAAETEPAPRTKGGLTASERNAFREIADRLRKQGMTNAGADVVSPFAAELKTFDEVEDTAPEIKAQPQLFAQNEADITDEAALLESLPVPIIIHARGQMQFVNQALLDLTGYESADAIKQTGGLEALFNSEPDETKSPQNMILRHKNGDETPVDAHLQMIHWQNIDGKTVQAVMLSSMPLISAEKTPVAPVSDQEELALQTQVEELKMILDTATDGVVLIDPTGRIRSMNHSASALFGYEAEHTQGKFFSMLFTIESQRAAMDYLHGLSNNGVLSVLNDGREVVGREANGGQIPLFMTIGTLPHSRGFCAVLRDITQWKRTEAELTSARKEAEQASRQKTDFLARISHEIRTPLNAIIGFSELMSDEKFGPIGNDRYRDYLRDINRSGTHVLTLVNDLLDISKIEAGALELKFEAVSLNEAIAEAIALMQPQANRERVIIRSSFQSNLPEIVADARSIRQIALNLLSNAVRFTPSGGQVIISTNYESSGDVIMRVRDTGIGMNKSEVEQALKPFRQINASRDRVTSGIKDWRNDGTGLGLPLTKAMVEANRAGFSIDSAPGQGTVIEIAFPPTRVLAD